MREFGVLMAFAMLLVAGMVVWWPLLVYSFRYWFG